MKTSLESPSQLEATPTPARQRLEFRLIFHDSVVSGLTEVLGAAGARAALFHLGFSETATATEVHRELVRVFGLGTQSLECSVLRSLFAALGSSFKPEGSVTFYESVEDARKLHVKPR